MRRPPPSHANSESTSKQAYGNALMALLSKTIDATNIQRTTLGMVESVGVGMGGFSFKNSSKQFTKKHEP